MRNLSLSTWNIHGLQHKTLADKTKNLDFINNINKLDFLFLTETWSNENVDHVAGFKAFVCDIPIPQTDKSCRISGGITLLYKSEYQKHVSIAKKSKNFLWCKISKILLVDFSVVKCDLFYSREVYKLLIKMRIKDVCFVNCDFASFILFHFIIVTINMIRDNQIYMISLDCTRVKTSEAFREVPDGEDKVPDGENKVPEGEDKVPDVKTRFLTVRTRFLRVRTRFLT
jgi:hypothetical protein